MPGGASLPVPSLGTFPRGVSLAGRGAEKRREVRRRHPPRRHIGRRLGRGFARRLGEAFPFPLGDRRRLQVGSRRVARSRGVREAPRSPGDRRRLRRRRGALAAVSARPSVVFSSRRRAPRPPLRRPRGGLAIASSGLGVSTNLLGFGSWRGPALSEVRAPLAARGDERRLRVPPRRRERARRSTGAAARSDAVGARAPSPAASSSAEGDAEHLARAARAARDATPRSRSVISEVAFNRRAPAPAPNRRENARGPLASPRRGWPTRPRRAVAPSPKRTRSPRRGSPRRRRPPARASAADLPRDVVIVAAAAAGAPALRDEPEAKAAVGAEPQLERAVARARRARRGRSETRSRLLEPWPPRGDERDPAGLGAFLGRRARRRRRRSTSSTSASDRSPPRASRESAASPRRARGSRDAESPRGDHRDGGLRRTARLARRRVDRRGQNAARGRTAAAARGGSDGGRG